MESWTHLPDFERGDEMSRLRVPVDSSDHIQGSQSVIYTLVEYGDYECPHCAAAYPVVQQLQEHFGEQLRFVFRNFPLTEIHPYAEAAAEAAEFAGTYNKYWQMHDLIFENQRALDGILYEIARKMKLPTQEFSEALEQCRFRRKIESDFSGGVRSGVNGTPTFFINGERIDGPHDFDSLVAAIQGITVST
jgi:protein-disulfide isomerase